jgi:phosphatidylserine/phosphatidylglycerophosphate/cardiolipin synthase-like enzyme
MKVLPALVLLLCACGQERSPLATVHSTVPNRICVPEPALFDFLNTTRTTEERLVDNGIHTRGAREILSYRNGVDGLPGTGDDQIISSMDELDRIAQVGPVTMKVLGSIGESLCAYAEVVFSPQDYSYSHLTRTAELIDDANSHIDIAMYSFRDSTVMDAIERAVQRGVGIRVLFHTASDDRKDPEGTRSADLEDLGIEVRWVNKIMHHKFALIDGPQQDLADAQTAILATGSGNWSYSAGTNFDENMVILSGDARIALSFQQEFNLLWDHARDLEWNEAIVPIEHIAITEYDLKHVAGAKSQFTSENFRAYESSRYGWTWTRDSDEATSAERLADFIWSAKESIQIASGHLRSRVITEALLTKAAADPHVDIQVYLDAQEYTSATYWQEEVEEYEGCVNQAWNEADDRDCAELGLHFGYALHSAGIDLRYKVYSYRWHYYYAAQMHHKTIIVDAKKVATGSYNFSTNAEFGTFENVVFYEDYRYPDLVQAYVDNFDSIWNTGEGLYDDLIDEIEHSESGWFPIIFDSMALDWNATQLLKETIRENCPDIDSDAFRSEPWEHHSCERG